MIFNLYIANHGKRDGIEDFMAILSDAVQRRGHEVVVTDNLDEKNINIVIDEFTNAIINMEIADFKTRYPDARLILVLTEFIERRLLVRSFNFFGGLTEAAIIAALNPYLRTWRKDFLPPSLKDWLIASLYAPMGLVYYLNHLRKNLRRKTRMELRRRIHSLAYMQMRYLGLEKMIAYFDGLILAHDMIANGLAGLNKNIPIIGTVYPEIDTEGIERNLFKDKQLVIEITGSVTSYRYRFIRRIDSMIKLLGLRHSFHYCHAIGFGSVKKTQKKRNADTPHLPKHWKHASINTPKQRGAYSLHPPQTRKWKYASPTRIYRALQYDHNMPVLTKVFGQHPIEKLCLEFKGAESLLDMYRYYKSPQKLLEHLEPLMTEYMETAKSANDAIVAAMVAGIKE